LLNEQALGGSGWQRQVYARYEVPWGGALRNREDVMSRLTVLRRYLDRIINLENEDQEDIARRSRDFAKKMIELLDQLLP